MPFINHSPSHLPLFPRAGNTATRWYCALLAYTKTLHSCSPHCPSSKGKFCQPTSWCAHRYFHTTNRFSSPTSLWSSISFRLPLLLPGLFISCSEHLMYTSLFSLYFFELLQSWVNTGDLDHSAILYKTAARFSHIAQLEDSFPLFASLFSSGARLKIPLISHNIYESSQTTKKSAQRRDFRLILSAL